MKKVLMIGLITMITTVSSFTYAQNPQRGKRGDKMNREQRIEQLSKELYLTDQQKKEFQTINNEFFTKMQAERNISHANKEEKRQSIQTLMNERDAKIKQLLTAEQYKQYTEKQQQMRNHLKGNRNNNRNCNNDCPCD